MRTSLARRGRLLGLITLSLLQLMGCAPPPTGAFAPTGYKNRVYNYEVVALPDGQLLPSSWKLDNYYLNENKRLVPKNADSYMTTLHLDGNGDGKYETEKTEYVYDLRYKNLVHNGVIFLRTIPISSDMEQKRLESLMDHYVEQIAGAGYEVVDFGSSSAVVEKRYAAIVADRGDIELAGSAAHVVTLDVANLDQLRLDPNARKERVRLVLLHTNFRYKTPGYVAADFPVLMFIGYANQPSDFDASLPDFEGLLSRIVIEDQRGFVARKAAEPSADVPRTPQEAAKPEPTTPPSEATAPEEPAAQAE